mmetsp:Transcript_39950/g.43310  ORF Transcript_39950/g.43310 Transcript_39950/m.43310 type:complete len:159 (-) Transcript_39950:1012-1488(-)
MQSTDSPPSSPITLLRSAPFLSPLNAERGSPIPSQEINTTSTEIVPLVAPLSILATKHTIGGVEYETVSTKKSAVRGSDWLLLRVHTWLKVGDWRYHSQLSRRWALHPRALQHDNTAQCVVFLTIYADRSIIITRLLNIAISCGFVGLLALGHCHFLH